MLAILVAGQRLIIENADLGLGLADHHDIHLFDRDIFRASPWEGPLGRRRVRRHDRGDGGNGQDPRTRAAVGSVLFGLPYLLVARPLCAVEAPAISAGAPGVFDLVRRHNRVHYFFPLFRYAGRGHLSRSHAGHRLIS